MPITNKELLKEIKKVQEKLDEVDKGTQVQNKTLFEFAKVTIFIWFIIAIVAAIMENAFMVSLSITMVIVALSLAITGAVGIKIEAKH